MLSHKVTHTHADTLSPLLTELSRIMEVPRSRQTSSEGEIAALSLIEGGSDDIDILPSWLHLGRALSLEEKKKGFCRSKVVISKGTSQAHLDSHTHTHTHTHTHLTLCRVL